jgi:hypothetical protein
MRKWHIHYSIGRMPNPGHADMTIEAPTMHAALDAAHH